MNIPQMPSFKDEAEEAAWHFENRDALDERFAQAIAEGRVRTTSMAQRVLSGQGAMVRLAEQDAAAAKLLAEKRGVPVVTLLSDLLHTAIQQEIERAA
jgi:predicted DNA binding CopG/RHH family protein